MSKERKHLIITENTFSLYDYSWENQYLLLWHNIETKQTFNIRFANFNLETKHTISKLGRGDRFGIKENCGEFK